MAASVGIAPRRTEEERAEAFSPFASDDDDGGFTARCASSLKIGLRASEIAPRRTGMQLDRAMRTLGSGRSKGWSTVGRSDIDSKPAVRKPAPDARIGRASHSPVGLPAGPA